MKESDIKENGGINLKNWNIRRAQIIVTYDCNMNCSFCINYNLGKKKKEYIKISDIVYFLQYLKYVEKIDDVIIVFLGGEPTLFPIDSLKEISDLVHSMGYKTEFYTNGTLKEKLLELDGYIDFITLSNYGKGLLPFDNMNYLYKFEKSVITISKLIIKQYFSSFKDFDRFVDKTNKLPFNYDFSTIQEFTPNFDYYHPDWFEKELLPLCDYQDVNGNIGAALYKGRLIKLPYVHAKKKETICTLKLYPNGNLNTTWSNDNSEINYKEMVNNTLKKINKIKL